MKYQYVSLHSLRNKHQNRCRCESDVLRIMPTGGIGKAPVETGQTLSVQFRSDPSEERGKIGGLGKEILSLQQSSGLKRTSGNFWSQNHSRKVLHLVGTGLFQYPGHTQSLAPWESGASTHTVIASEHSSWSHQSNMVPAQEMGVVHFHGCHTTFSTCESYPQGTC